MSLRNEVRAGTLTAASLLLGAGLVAGREGVDTKMVSTVLLDNARVRVFRGDARLTLSSHPAAVVVSLEDGDAYWTGDPPRERRSAGPLIVVEPKASAPPPAATPRPQAELGAPAPPPGFSFKPLFDNEHVRVIRGRMEEKAQEGFHTHASDIVLIHISGGTVEDTAGGRTTINRWPPGAVEFEARGSSHSARNLGPAVEAVLVFLKP